MNQNSTDCNAKVFEEAVEKFIAVQAHGKKYERAESEDAAAAAAEKENANILMQCAINFS